MEREEACKLLKEIVASGEINISSFNLIPPSKDNTLSKGYQLHIKVACDKSFIQQIVMRNGLASRVEGELTVIYKPLPIEDDGLKRTPNEQKFFEATLVYLQQIKEKKQNEATKYHAGEHTQI